MMTDTANRRNLNFLLLFGVFCFCGFESHGDPVFSIYKSQFHNNGSTRDIVKAKNKIYINRFSKLGARDQRNNLYNKIHGKALLDYYYPNDILSNEYTDCVWNEGDHKNDINRIWNLRSIDNSIDDQFVYMDDYRSRLFPSKDYVFYDHYLSLRQSSKKDHHSFRKFLHNFRVHISTGISGAYDRTNVDGFFFKDNGKYFLIPTLQSRPNHHAYQVGWFGSSYKKVPIFDSSSRLAKLDPNRKIYTGWIGSFNFINVGISYDVWKRLRLELDFGFKGNHIEKLKRHYQTEKNKSSIHAKASPDNIDEVLLPKSTFFSSDLGFLVGMKIFHTTFWSILLNFQTYFTFFLENFKIVEGNFIGGLYSMHPGFAGGITFERHWSDYMSFFVKGMLGNIKLIWKDEWTDNAKCYVEHNIATFALTLGVNFTSSYIDKCDDPRGCKIKEVHIHNSKEYRGLNKWEYRSPYGKVIHSVK